MFNLQAQITLIGNSPLMLIGGRRKSNNPFAEQKKETDQHYWTTVSSDELCKTIYSLGSPKLKVFKR